LTGPPQKQGSGPDDPPAKKRRRPRAKMGNPLTKWRPRKGTGVSGQ